MLKFSELPSVTKGSWLVEPSEDTFIFGGQFDTRNIVDENVFFAWKGEQVDGHNYLSQLVGTSIKVAITEKNVSAPAGVAVLKTENSLEALWNISKAIYSRFHGKTVAITGSSGKTTFKNWLSQALGEIKKTCFSSKNFNNHIGCPITLLKLCDDHDFLILEMGTNHIGEIDFLSEMFPPDISVILNIGHAHSGVIGGIENIRLAKAEIALHLKKSGKIFLPKNDEQLKQVIIEKFKKQGSSRQICLFPEYVCETHPQSPLEQEVFLAHPKLGELQFQTSAIGKYVGMNFSLIISIAEELGIQADKLLPCLHALKNESGRMSVEKGFNDTWIVNDAYNANPESVAHLVDILSDWKGNKKILVLGDLAELAEDYEKSSSIIAHGLRDKSIELIVIKGGTAEKIATELIKSGEQSVTFMESEEQVLNYCRDVSKEGNIIAIKGSNSSQIYRLVPQLLEK